EVGVDAVAAAAQPAVEIPLEGVAAMVSAHADVWHEALDKQVEMVRVQCECVAGRQLADRVDRLQPFDPRGERSGVLIHGPGIAQLSPRTLATFRGVFWISWV